MNNFMTVMDGMRDGILISWSFDFEDGSGLALHILCG